MPRNKLTTPEKIARHTIAENLKKLSHGMTQVELSEKTGIPASTLSGYFAERSTPNEEALEKIANVLHIRKSDIDPRYLIRSSSKLPSNLIDTSQLKHVRVPIVGDIACGTPITAEQNVEGYHDVYLKHVPAGKLFALRCKGDSMEPRIPNGAYVTIHQQPTIETDEVAAVLINGEATLKQFKQMDSRHAILYPFNTKYEPIFLDGNDDVTILGKAIHYDGEL